jgi:homocysteine S-methyltransferase
VLTRGTLEPGRRPAENLPSGGSPNTFSDAGRTANARRSALRKTVTETAGVRSSYQRREWCGAMRCTGKAADVAEGTKMSYAKVEAKLRRGEVVLLDGGTGTELEKRGVVMDPRAWCGPATLENVDILEAVHRDYIAAGADIITANTYASSRLMLEPAGYADRFEELNRTAVAAALRARDQSGRSDVLVAGSLSQMCPMTPDSARPDLAREPSPAKMRDAFRELADLLRDAGCDLILLEMMFYPHRVRLVLEAAVATGLPVWAGFSVRREEDGAIVSFAPEQSIPFEDVLATLDGVDVQAAGIMHSSSDVIEEAVAEVRSRFDGPLLAYPDSGYFRMPHWQFEQIIAPEALVAFAQRWVAGGVTILGGCCGLSPEHIAALREAFPRSAVPA